MFRLYKGIWLAVEITRAIAIVFMKSAFLTLAIVAPLAAASGFWNETTTETYYETTTDYVTYCPGETTVTVTTCDETCGPKEVTVTEATTLTITGECLVPIVSPLVTTDYVTTCTEATTVTLTTCSNNVCGHHTVTVESPTTLTVTGECLVTGEGEHGDKTTETETTIAPTHVTTDYTTVCPEATTITITSCKDNACGKHTVTALAGETLTLSGVVVPTEIETQPAPTTTANTVETVETVAATVTDFTTYCPEATTFVLLTCSADSCQEHTVSALSGETVVVSGTVVVASLTTQKSTVAAESVTASTLTSAVASVASLSTVPASVFLGGAAKAAVGSSLAALLGALMML